MFIKRSNPLNPRDNQVAGNLLPAGDKFQKQEVKIEDNDEIYNLIYYRYDNHDTSIFRF